MHYLIKEIQVSEKLKNFRAVKRKDQFSLSKALQMSSLRHRNPLLRLYLSFWKSSKARPGWCWTFLPWMKAAWWVEMMDGRIWVRREARILDIILCEKFSRLIGLKSTKVSGDFVFGMRARKKALEAFRIFLVLKKCWTAWEIDFPMMLQVEVKKTPLNPSGPEELLFF